MFFSFDGIDGAGKSTQIERFVAWLEEQGMEVVVCRDPGSTQIGERLRTLLLDRESETIHTRAEMLIYMAARVQLVEHVIRPALLDGKAVVCDRFLLANIAYQGYGGGVDIQFLKEVGRWVVDSVSPGLTFLLDIDVKSAIARLDRPFDRMEAKGGEFLSRVAEGYRREAELAPATIRRIDATQAVEAIETQIREAALAYLAQART